MNYAVKCPAEEVEVILVGTEGGGVIRTILVITVHGIEVLNVICLGPNAG